MSSPSRTSSSKINGPTRHDTRVAPGNENTAIMTDFPLPGPPLKGEAEKVRPWRDF
jgi:hypothetical protein